MSGLDEVLARIANDPTWADAVRTNPTDALRGYDLDPDELSRLEHAMGTNPGPPPPIFQTPEPVAAAADASTAAGTVDGGAAAATGGVGAAAATAGVGKFPLVLAGLAIVGAGLGVGLGAAGVFGSRAGTPLRADAASVLGCSDDTTRGPVIATLHRGDRVWVIGRSGASWLVIRNPERLTTPGWISAASLEYSADPGVLPELTCSTAAAAAAVDPTSATTSPTSLPSPTSSTEAPTSSGASSSATTKPSTSTRPTTSAPTRPSASTTTPTTAPPPPADTTGPALTVTPDSTFLYSEGGAACAAYRQQVNVTVTATDPSGATIDSVTWKAGSLSGTATKTGTGTYRIGPVYSTHTGTISMVLTVTAHDGKGNVSTTTRNVDFRQIAETCIG